MGFNVKTVWRFQTEKKYISSLAQTNPWNSRPSNVTNDDGPCNQDEVKGRKIESALVTRKKKTG